MRGIKVTPQTPAGNVVAPCLRARLAQARLRRSSKIEGKPRVSLVLAFETRGLQAWYGNGSFRLPSVRAADDATKAMAAKHLAAALKHFAEAKRLAPEQAIPWLGFGWASQHAGKTADAIAGFRKAFELAWKTDGKKNALGLAETPISQEAAAMLMPLLDPKKDAAEIGRLGDAQHKLSLLMRPVTPLVIPLRPGLTLSEAVDPQAGVAFDLDGSGVPRRWGWPTPAAGWLVWDGLDGPHRGRASGGLDVRRADQRPGSPRRAPRVTALTCRAPPMLSSKAMSPATMPRAILSR